MELTNLVYDEEKQSMIIGSKGRGRNIHAGSEMYATDLCWTPPCQIEPNLVLTRNRVTFLGDCDYHKTPPQRLWRCRIPQVIDSPER